MSTENLNINNQIENKEKEDINKVEAIGTIPPDDEEKLANIYLSNHGQKQILVHHYTESKKILNDLQEELTAENIGQLKDRILEREKDIQNLQSRINSFEQANKQIFGQLSQSAKEKYLRN